MELYIDSEFKSSSLKSFALAQVNPMMSTRQPFRQPWWYQIFKMTSWPIHPYSFEYLHKIRLGWGGQSYRRSEQNWSSLKERPTTVTFVPWPTTYFQLYYACHLSQCYASFLTLISSSSNRRNFQENRGNHCQVQSGLALSSGMFIDFVFHSTRMNT